MAAKIPLVVFSHLRWDFVYQRPQQLLSRLTNSTPVLFIEEPVEGSEAGWQRIDTDEGVTVWRPVLPGRVHGFGTGHQADLINLMRVLARRESLDGAIAWLYTPMALPLARSILPELVVYDCMDELSLFQGAPPELLALESELMVDADLVFTGGPSLYRAKTGRHPNVFCFPSSVDASHFHQANPDLPTREPEVQRAIPHPRLGFYGVIDERLDLALLDALAETRPEWQIILVGPVVKIDPATLPRRSNIHYFGQQPYADLPRFLSGWDVCLLPFALNDATRFISPTKTLEYMAAERAIVSTPIRDVVEPYAGIVAIGKTAADFVTIIENALAKTTAQRATERERMREIVQDTTWETTAERMWTLICQELNRAEGQTRRVIKDCTAHTEHTHSALEAGVKS
jgi:UDP-galactopyranose mutase